MNRQKFYQIIRFCLFVFLLLGVGMVGSETAVAQQPTGDRWATWEVAVDFPNDELLVQLLITIGRTDAKTGKESILHTLVKDLACNEHGYVEILNEVAHFQGDGSYFSCYMPDIAEIVSNMTKGEMQIGAQCDCKNPWALGTVTPEQNPSGAEPLQPIFYRHDIKFSTPLTTHGKSQLQFDVDSVTAYSGNFVLGQPGYDVYAAFEPIPNSPNQSSVLFEVDGVALTAAPSTINQPMNLSTGATEIYIGYDPANDVYFEGLMEKFRLDPACLGVG